MPGRPRGLLPGHGAPEVPPGPHPERAGFRARRRPLLGGAALGPDGGAGREGGRRVRHRDGFDESGAVRGVDGR
eukprot:3889820-Lingulodinium_polyedra.AAC.1